MQAQAANREVGEVRADLVQGKDRVVAAMMGGRTRRGCRRRATARARPPDSTVAGCVIRRVFRQYGCEGRYPRTPAGQVILYPSDGIELRLGLIGLKCISARSDPIYPRTLAPGG